MSSTPEFDVSEFAEHTRQMQATMARTRERIESLQATGDDGTGLVTATVGGDGRIAALRIDPSVIDPIHPTALSDLVVAATNNAIDALRELHAESIIAVTDQIGGLLDGLGNGLLGEQGEDPGWPEGRQ
ncbi:YbaB/EbfC family nucleoid-associated protein [Promicromonospora sukumoe]|uniref:YbaB/EbfC family nucleoid-associated protein n=1 Tax=Promicromonospora sukumoe TaxID=88382 RepID=UPI0037CB8B71